MKPDVADFDRKLAEILDEQPASHLLSIPGIYEILADYYCNDVVRALDEDLADDTLRAASGVEL